MVSCFQKQLGEKKENGDDETRSRPAVDEKRIKQYVIKYEERR
jgi:hypothetical protein